MLSIFWGAGCGTNTSSTGLGCNGDGNGLVQQENSEQVKLWIHLSRAGLIARNFPPGIYALGWSQLIPSNTPKSNFANTYWSTMYDHGSIAGGSGSQRGLILTNGILGPQWTFGEFGAVSELKRDEAWKIDTKIDDGKANTGRVRGGIMGSCFDVGTDYYSIAANSLAKGCGLYFILI